MKLEQRDIAAAAKFTSEELNLINDTAESLIPHNPRPIVLMALASHLIGIVIRGSEGTLSKQLVVDLVDKGVEEEPEKSPLFEEAVAIVRTEGRAGTALLQRRLKIGYVESSILMDQLEAAKIIGPKDGAKPRKVL